MSIQENGDEKPKLSARDIAIIVGVIAALAIAGTVITKEVQSTQVHNVIVIHGAKGAKPMGNDAGAASDGGGASDRVIKTQ